MSFAIKKLWHHLMQAMLLASVLMLLPVFVSAAEQAKAIVEPTHASAEQVKTQIQSIPAQANAISNDSSTGFDLSLPVDFNRCQMTHELNSYVDRLAPDDIESLVNVQKFLVDCQKIMEQYLSKTQNKLSELKANVPAIEAAAKAIDEAEAEATAKVVKTGK